MKSRRFRFFLFLSGLLFFINLLLMNEVTTVWNGQEAAMFWEAFRPAGSDYLPAFLVGWFALTPDTFTFWPRTLGGILLLISCGAFYTVGRKILGPENVVYTLLVLGSSLAIPFLAKMATADVYVFSFHFMGTICLLRFLKQPHLVWRMACYGLIALSILVAPLSSLVYFFTYSALLYVLHPNGKRLWDLNPWLMGLIAVAIFQFFGWLVWRHPGRIFGLLSEHYLTFLWVSILGIAPFFGFFIGGVRDLVAKLRRKEELAIITVGWLAAGVLSQSLVLQAALALLIAKQMLMYGPQRYPWVEWVRTGAVLTLVALFFGVCWLLLWSYGAFGGVGFRSALAVGGLFWALSFVGIIGLFGFNRRYWVAGPILAGLAATWLFWLQLNPLLELRRSWPEEAMAIIRTDDQAKTNVLVIHAEPDRPFPNVAIYGKRLLGDRVEVREATRGEPLKSNEILLYWNGLDSTANVLPLDTVMVQSWTDYLRPETVVLRWPTGE